jgi:hypothetical protein
MTNKNIEEIPHLLLVVDAGASLIKAMASIAGTDADDCEPIAILPYCVVVEKTELLQKNEDFDKNSLWIKIGEEYIAMGHFASVHYPARIDARSSKDDTVVQKVCGVIALCTQRFQLPQTFKLTINLLLPPGEQAIKDYFKDDLAAALKNLSTPASRIKPKLLGVTVLSEGMGVWLNTKQSYELKEKKWAVIMSGFRNTSLIVTNAGQIVDRKTCQTGLYAMLTQISGGYDLVELLEPVADYLQYRNEGAFDYLLKSKNKDRERTQLISSIQAAKRKMIQTLTDYLADYLPPQLDLIVKCGGTFDTIQKDLDSVLNDKLASGCKIIRDDGNNVPLRHVARRFNGGGNYHSRYCDVYYVWHKLHQKSQVAEI